MSPEKKFKQRIAQHLKSIRKQRKLSLDAVAKLTGVSKAMLGQIEREESSPTIAKLWQISSGLESSFSAFLNRNEAILESTPQHFADDPNMSLTTISPFDPAVNFEIFEIQLQAHHCQMSESHAPGVIETIWVLEGEMQIYSDGKWHTVNKKESLRFYADQAHGYKAISEKALFQNIVSYPCS